MKNINTSHKLEENQSLKKKAIALLSKAIAKIILKFRLPRAEIINALDEQLVLEAKKQDPQASNVTIAIRTGISRRYIPALLKGEPPRTKPDKLATILEDLRWTAHKYYNSNKLPKLGHFRTFQSICEQRASGMLTYQAILDEYIKRGNIKDLGGKVEVINLNQLVNDTEVAFSNLTAKQIYRTVNTITYNFSEENIKNRFIQKTIYSTQINPKKFPKLHLEFQKLIDVYYKELTKKLIDYEDDVEANTYPQYGMAFLEYKSEE